MSLDISLGVQSDINHEIVLEGCSPVPLASYLKALGILRLISEQADADAKGSWHHESFHLQCRLSKDQLVQFFLYEYRPSPIIAPWNGGSGFYPQRETAFQAVDWLRTSRAARLAPYREVIAVADEILQRLGLESKPKSESKDLLISECRNWLPDSAVEWMDAVLMLTPEGTHFPPLLGTGGNDGNLEFTNNFMQRLQDLMDRDSGSPSPKSLEWLQASLFHTAISGLKDVSIGQFSPGTAGGPNSRAGFAGSPQVNPWDYVLMMEGALGFSASTSRRLESGGRSFISYPFTVAPSSAGHGGVAKQDEDSARAEMWMPLWSRPSKFSELRAVLREGRAQVNGKNARTGLDFANACARLGVDRGIDSFQRFAFMQRSGMSYLAVPLTRFWVRRRVEADLLDDLTQRGWLDRLARAARSQGQSVQSAYRRVAEAMFQLCQHGGAQRVQVLLRELGEVERLLADRPSLREALEPLVLDSGAWLDYAQDGSPEFELAVALAGLSWPGGPAIRAYFSPVDPVNPRQWAKDGSSNRVVWQWGELSRNLVRLVERRLLDAEHPDWGDTCPDGKPFRGRRRARLGTIVQFLTGSVDERRVDALVWGLLPCTPSVHAMRPSGAEDRTPVPGWVPWPYAVTKLVLTPDQELRQAISAPPASDTGDALRVPIPQGLVQTLASGDIRRADRAVRTAERRLYASGITPKLRNITSKTIHPRRILAACVWPVPRRELAYLARLVAEDPDQEPPASERTAPATG
ncbi:MAG: type I-U CRISPR-associated protein Csx17 [Alicyclobacillus sp.]|nr:type I-U CRISPR-associated protein Csx17 [Alicyclobacillus sp.]